MELVCINSRKDGKTKSLFNIICRMIRFKKTLSLALEHCDECEEQNLIIMDTMVEDWINDLLDISSISVVDIEDELNRMYPNTFWKLAKRKIVFVNK